MKQRSNHETKLNIWPNGFNMPIMFCDLVGKESLDGLSKSNPDEAVKAVRYNPLHIQQAFEYLYSSGTNSASPDRGVQRKAD